MTTCKRKRPLFHDTYMQSASRTKRTPACKLLVSTFLCLQLLSAPSTYAFTTAGHQRIRNFSSVRSAPISPLYAVSSNELSTNNSLGKIKNPITKRSKEEVNRLFTSYNKYKTIQEAINDLGMSDASLADQSDALNMSQSTLETILTNGYNARQTLLLENIPLVHYTVKKIRKQRLNSLSREDLIQEGTIGLIKAIDKFDATLGNAFSTYAVYWIRASVLRCIQQREEMIRVPEYLERAIRAVDSAMKEQEQLGINSKDLYSSIDLDEVAKSTGLTTNVVKEALKVKQRRMLQSSRREGYNELEEYMMRDPKLQLQNENGQNSIAREGQLEHFKDILAQFLSIKEMEALSWRYGLLQEDIPEPVQVDLRSGRDYEAEAEKDLFGPNGILSPSETSTKRLYATASIKAEAPRAKITVSPQVSENKGGRWGEAMSFKEVGDNMRVSAEYGRRLCSSALKKLRAAAEEGRLDPAMLF